MDCITFTANGEEERPAHAAHRAGAEPEQALYVSGALKTGARDGEG